jgi:hypothetical protein
MKLEKIKRGKNDLRRRGVEYREILVEIVEEPDDPEHAAVAESRMHR